MGRETQTSLSTAWNFFNAQSQYIEPWVLESVVIPGAMDSQSPRSISSVHPECECTLFLFWYMSLTASHYRTPKQNWLWWMMMIWISFIQLVNTAMIYTKHSSFSTVERILWGCCHTIAKNFTGNWGWGWQYIFKSVFESQVQYSLRFIYSQAAPQIFWIFETGNQHESAWFILLAQFTVHPFL